MTPAERLFHFSEDGSIGTFVPRPVATRTDRPDGMEWLNGPLVWAISAQRQAAYLFPRDCPRILLWQTPDTTAADRTAWWGASEAPMIACVETGWHNAIRSTSLYRYELPTDTFRAVDGDWAWVSEVAVEPLAVVGYDDLIAAHHALATDLRFMDSFRPLREVWSTSFHASGIRLRNARNWPG